MRRFDVEQDGALAGALLVGALLAGAGAVGLEACPLVALAAALAVATLDCEADGWLVAWPPAPELLEPQPAARIAAMATIPPVSEF